MKNLNILIKPSSSLCDMNCYYCFYHKIAGEREVRSYGFMTLETLETIVKKALEFSDGGVVTFAFQGGEPTLSGLPFFKKFIEFSKKYNLKNSQINNVLQTNGININEEWAIFLKENNFLVGLSLDGKKDLNDKRRILNDGSGSYERIMNGKRIMDKFRVEYNVLSVIDKEGAKEIVKTYAFLKAQGIKYMQFIPCLDPLKSPEIDFSDYSLTAKDYGEFLKKLFDLWYLDISRGNMISIRYFDNLLDIILGSGAEACNMRGICSIQNVIEADGSVYPCDFYVYDEWNLGNINKVSFEEIITSNRGKEFIETSMTLSDKCSECEFLQICRGGCRRERNENLNKFCEAYKIFFEYAGERLMQIARRIYENNK